MQRKSKQIRNPELQVPTQTDINLNGNARQEVLKILNVILADEAVLSLKTRSAHWNVCGESFVEWHKLFDFQFLQLNKIFDDISKHTWQMGGLPNGSLEEFLQNTRLRDLPEKQPYYLGLVDTQEIVIQLLREDASKCTEVYEDPATSDFLFQILDQHGKMVLALRSEFDYVQNNGKMKNEVL